ncbi:unnamed protein product [Victoria cruziana]
MLKEPIRGMSFYFNENIMFSTAAEDGKTSRLGIYSRRAVKLVLISLTGGFALSAFDDLAIYHGCSSKAIEKASENQRITEAIGQPIVRGPWYNASLAVAHRRHSVSCTFPVSGPKGSGIFQLKAVRHGDSRLFTFLSPQDWDILIMEALVHVPGDDERQQTFRISLTNPSPDTGVESQPCMPQASNADNK